MQSSSGTRIGPDEVIGAIAAGGVDEENVLE
jgi:hypothetical protein